MNKLTVSVLLGLFLISCTSKDSFKITATTDSSAKMAYLEQSTTDGVTTLDSARISGGKFTFSHIRPSATSFYRIKVDSTSYVVAIDSTERLTADFASDGAYTISGSPTAESICRASQIVRTTNADIRRAMSDCLANPIEQDSLSKAIYDKVMSYRTWADSIIISAPQDIASYYVLTTDLVFGIKAYDFKAKEDYRLLARAANAWKAKDADSPITTRLIQMIDDSKRTDLSNVGFSDKSSFVDLTLPDAYGNPASLSRFKDKNIVLLFCSIRLMDRETLEEMERYYKEYGDVEFYHVSYDKDYKAFQKVAQRYPWTCVDDTLCGSAITYNIEDLPTVYLFNKRGNFVGKNVPFLWYKF